MSSCEAVKIRLDPTPRQERMLTSHAGAARFAYSTGFTAPTARDPYGLKLPRVGRVH